VAALFYEKERLEMNRTKRSILSLILVVALLAITTSAAFAKELGLLTISGPGIKGDVTLKDPEAMMNLEKSGFFDQTAFVKPPENLGEGYNITAQLNLDGKMVPFVEMVYYPTSESEAGYVHYTGRLNGEKLQTVDQWNKLSVLADKAFRSLMTANNIALQSALIKAPEVAEPAAPVVAEAKEPAVAAPAVSPGPTPAETSYLVPAVIAAILLFVGAGLVLRRRTVSHSTT
jgi:hypothetical protein